MASDEDKINNLNETNNSFSWVEFFLSFIGGFLISFGLFKSIFGEGIYISLIVTGIGFTIVSYNFSKLNSIEIRKWEKN